MVERTGQIKLPRGRKLNFDTPLVMGVINVTPDSFSDGGKYLGLEDAVRHACKIIEEKANIIDIGGESSRPGADPVPLEEELARTIPVIKAIREFSDIPISIDTTKGEVARHAIEAGADIINDISALMGDRRLPDVAAEFKVPVVLMHMKGQPKTMQKKPTYVDCIREINDFFEVRTEYAISCGIDRGKIIIDPGIGFGKRLEDNLSIIKHFDVFKSLGYPLMVGVSRKSFIQNITQENDDPVQRLGGSLAAAMICVCHGADIVRAHDVRETVEAIRVWKAVEES